MKNKKTEGIIIKGTCLTFGQKEAVEEGGDLHMNYTLTDDGVLTISGNTLLGCSSAVEGVPLYDQPMYDYPDEGKPEDYWSRFTSQFKDIDFHTVVIENGVKCLGVLCFKDCKNFRKIVLPEEMPVIRKTFAMGSPLEYHEKDGLLFLGPPSNPLYYLMGCKDDFDKETLIIPEGTVYIADYAFKDKKCIKEVRFPSTLEFAGWYTFDDTSIKDVFIPEGKLAYDETLIAFDGKDINLESISVPYSMYKEYKEGNDRGWVEAANRTAKIIFRNTDDSIAEILQPHPLAYGDKCDAINNESPFTPDSGSDELPF